MGKGWKNHPKKGGGGGGEGGGGGKKGGFYHDFSSCRGFGIILGTSDAAKERETSRELVSLVNDAIERIYPDSLKPIEQPKPTNNEPNETSTSPATTTSLSIAELMKREISEVKEKKSLRNTTAVSIQTGVKGITLIKLLKPEYCPIALVKNIFQQIEKEKQPYTKYTIRVIPLKYVFFPNLIEFEENIAEILHKEVGIPLPSKKIKPKIEIAEGKVSNEEADKLEGDDADEMLIGEKRKIEEVTSHEVVQVESKVQKLVEQNLVTSSTETPILSHVPISKVRYVIQFKARNHNVLTKLFAHEKVNQLLQTHGIADYKNAEVSIVIEALKNLCGVSYFNAKEYHEFEEFNIRKFQSKHCIQSQQTKVNISQPAKKPAEFQNDKSDTESSEEGEEIDEHQDNVSNEDSLES